MSPPVSMTYPRMLVLLLPVDGTGRDGAEALVTAEVHRVVNPKISRVTANGAHTGGRVRPLATHILRQLRSRPWKVSQPERRFERDSQVVRVGLWLPIDEGDLCSLPLVVRVRINRGRPLKGHYQANVWTSRR
jgi:hypothetical protein